MARPSINREMLSFWMLSHSEQEMSTTLSPPYFEYYQSPLIFIIPFFCHFNNERRINILFIFFFSYLWYKKLQFSENIKTIIKIQRFNWMAVSAEFFSTASFSCFFFSGALSLKFKGKIIYQIMRVHPKQAAKIFRAVRRMFCNIQIYIFLCWFTFYLQLCCCYLFILLCVFFWEASKDDEGRQRSRQSCSNSKCRPLSFFAKKDARKAKATERFTLNWLSFKCLWFVFFINFAVAFHPLSERCAMPLCFWDDAEMCT